MCCLPNFYLFICLLGYCADFDFGYEQVTGHVTVSKSQSDEQENEIEEEEGWILLGSILTTVLNLNTSHNLGLRTRLDLGSFIGSCNV